MKRLLFSIMLFCTFAPLFAQTMYSGDGGKDIQIAVLTPVMRNVPDSSVAASARDTLVSNFKTYSAITVADEQSVEDAEKNQTLSATGLYTDRDCMAIGEAVGAGYVLIGVMIGGTGVPSSQASYSLQLSLVNAATGGYMFTFQKRCALADLRNGAALNDASASLLGALGVSLTDDAYTALAAKPASDVPASDDGGAAASGGDVAAPDAGAPAATGGGSPAPSAAPQDASASDVPAAAADSGAAQ
jgi:hypothetical protein